MNELEKNLLTALEEDFINRNEWLYLDSEKKIKKILKKWGKKCKEDKGNFLPDDNEKSRFYQKAERRANRVLNNEVFFSVGQVVFQDMQDLYLYYTHYHILESKDFEKARNYFKESSYFGNLAIIKLAEIDISYPSFFNSILMHKALLYFSQNVLCDWEENYLKILDLFIESIEFGIQYDEEDNKVAKIIDDGLFFTPASWFILELFAKVYDKRLDKTKADYPSSMKPYEEVLEKWDSKDLKEVNKMIYMLAQTHLDGSRDEIDDNEYLEFSDFLIWLFPYEILVWLKLREKNGLENPKEFAHPLMNQPVAEFFLDYMKKTHEYPKKLPFAKELLKKLEDSCPSITKDKNIQ